ncbi:MAG TPA: helix-turn-helix transcriptional regulator, partial [Candidatus Limnocylindrales bacterium]|nr:helix-turn-helix transcriptional regulator [Candidatus Limnocylindrales bacterium]
MDDVTLGLSLRRVRLRRDERQADVAARAGVGTSAYSEIERGLLDGVTLRTLRRVCGALEVRLDLLPRWRGGDLDRLIHGRHAVMGAVLARRLAQNGWEVVPEASFSIYGERGVIDLLAWHPGRGALLIVELKTELVDANEMLGSMDRRLRLARRIAAERGWLEPATVSGWVVIAESSMNRRRVGAVQQLLRAAFSEDGRAAKRWLRSPDRRQLALHFLADSGGAGA